MIIKLVGRKGTPSTLVSPGRADSWHSNLLSPPVSIPSYTSVPVSSIAPAPGIYIPLDQPVERVELVVLGDGS